MPIFRDKVEKLLDKGKHVMYHDEVHCPVTRGRNSSAYFYTDEFPFLKKHLVNFCSMCGAHFEKRTVKKISDFITIIK